MKQYFQKGYRMCLTSSRVGVAHFCLSLTIVIPIILYNISSWGLVNVL